jgi:chromosome segregation ATPase
MNYQKERLTQDAIDTACLALIGRGENLSSTKVHKEVGERGSFSTIQKMIKDWQARNPEQSEQVENLPLKIDIPESLKNAGDNALKAFWHQAREIAHNELEIQREALKKAEDDVNLKIEELQEFSDNQANSIEVLREQLGQVTIELNEHKAALDTERATTTALTEELNSALHDLELSNIESRTLTQRLTESKESHDKQVSELKADIVKRDADSDKLRADFDKRIKTSEESVKSLDKQVTKLQTALDIQDKQITETKAERAAALLAEKLALEKAAALSGQLEQVLKDVKQFTAKEIGKIEPVKKVIHSKKESAQKNPTETIGM